MRRNISDPSNTVVTTPAMAPPTKRLMHWKMNGGVEKIFGVPGRQLNSHGLLGGYKVGRSWHSLRFILGRSKMVS